jgi:predicted transcriptional regulator
MPTDSEDAWRAIVDTNTKIDELTVERERLLVRHQELRDALSQAIEEGGAAAPEHADSAE